MSHAHKDVVAELVLPTTHKAVLWQLAHRACQFCGLAWPGVPWLARTAGVSQSTVRISLAWLEEHRHVVVHWRARGGRGFTTEYVVLPVTLDLSQPPPCPKCVSNLKGHGGQK
jgi:hypothetical protein